MYSGIKLWSQVRCCTKPMEEQLRPWWSGAESNKRDKLQKCYGKQQCSKQVVHRCTESEGNIETCQYTMKTEGPFKKLWNSYTISIQGMVFPTNLCTAFSFFDNTPTQLLTYVHTQLHTDLHRCMHTSTSVVREHVHTVHMYERMYVYESAHWSMEACETHL